MPAAIINSEKAGVAQLVECKLPKLDVAGSSPVARSKYLTFLPCLTKQVGVFCQ